MDRKYLATGVLGLLLVAMIYFIIMHAIPTIRAAFGAEEYLKEKGWRYVELLPIRRLDNCQQFIAYEPISGPPTTEEFNNPIAGNKTHGKVCYTWNGKIRLRRLDEH